jgi:hypothetical protein
VSRQVGKKLGEGLKIEEITASMPQVAEGVATAVEVVELANKHRCRLFILTAAAKVRTYLFQEAEGVCISRHSWAFSPPACSQVCMFVAKWLIGLCNEGCVVASFVIMPLSMYLHGCGWNSLPAYSGVAASFLVCNLFATVEIVCGCIHCSVVQGSLKWF